MGEHEHDRREEDERARRYKGATPDAGSDGEEVERNGPKKDFLAQSLGRDFGQQRREPRGNVDERLGRQNAEQWRSEQGEESENRERARPGPPAGRVNARAETRYADGAQCDR